jgi:hypothetical protein
MFRINILYTTKKKLKIEETTPRLFNTKRIRGSKTIKGFNIQYKHNIFLTFDVKYEKYYYKKKRKSEKVKYNI